MKPTERITTVKEIKGVGTGKILPEGLNLKLLDMIDKKYLVEHNNLYWLLSTDQAKVA